MQRKDAKTRVKKVIAKKINSLGKKSLTKKRLSPSEENLSNTELLEILIQIRNGNFSQKLPSEETGNKGAVYKILNEIIEGNEKMAFEFKLTNTNNGKQEVLRKANEELKEKADLLALQKKESEVKNKDIEEARKSLEDKANQLALNSKYKSEFLANMSHELRTPLNSLQILAHELIENHEGNLNEKQIQFAKTIKACGEELIDLINDILDLSKIESGHISIDYSLLSVNEIINYVENTFRLTSNSKRLRFTIETEGDLADSIETDSQRLYQILKNLLSNSFKFTEKGSVKLKVYKTKHKLYSENKSEEVIAFEISDTGIGISKEKQNLIFEAFQQAEGSTSRKYGGTGLGLSISKGLSQLLGGVIELESEIDEGSKFTLFLPLKISESIKDKVIEREKIVTKKSIEVLPSQTRKRNEQFAVNKKFFSGKKVLIVDDDGRNLFALTTALERFGLNIITSESGMEALEIIDGTKDIDIVLMDIMMPEMDGYETMKKIRLSGSNSNLPIIAVTAKAMKGDRQKCIESGASDYITKPVNIDELIAMLLVWMKKEVSEVSENDFKGYETT